MIKKRKTKKRSKRKNNKKIEARTKILLSIMLIIVINSLLVFVYFFKKEVDQRRENYIVQIEENIKLKNKIKEMTEGYPIERMASIISRKDEKTAAFLIGIAKKESNWGKRSPKLNGKDCYNYWGYREKRERMGTGGHTCFDSPRDAVNTVARRIKELIDSGANSPSTMVVWKCGYSCDAHSKYSVNKWVSDVGYYYDKF